MDLFRISLDPTVQEIMARIENACTDTTHHRDWYDFLSGVCDINQNGETKTVFLHEDWDFVIKVPNYYHYANHNYCQLEADNYKKACAYRVERVLLETALLCTLKNGIQLYVQPRYTIDNNDYIDDAVNRCRLQKKCNAHRKPIVSKVADGMYDGFRLNNLWLARTIQLYGKKFMRSLEKWTMENRIGDLHDCNVGWMNNKPIILDYSGYFGH